ncbi:MAG: dihydroneopterin aldolase [Lentisphaeria bacterium]|nr:dihydroneopterin aldolase [Lentisphaeria bacterium]
MDTIFIRDLEVHAIIGTLPEERLAPQKLILNLEIFTDMERAAISDDLRDAVDYSKAEAIVKETAESSSFFLLEALAGKLCQCVKTLPGVQNVRISIDKPAAAQFARSIAVQMER